MGLGYPLCMLLTLTSSQYIIPFIISDTRDRHNTLYMVSFSTLQLHHRAVCIHSVIDCGSCLVSERM